MKSDGYDQWYSWCWHFYVQFFFDYWDFVVTIFGPFSVTAYMETCWGLFRFESFRVPIPGFENLLYRSFLSYRTGPHGTWLERWGFTTDFCFVGCMDNIKSFCQFTELSNLNRAICVLDFLDPMSQTPDNSVLQWLDDYAILLQWLSSGQI